MSNVNKLRSDLRRSYQQHIIDSGWEAAYGGGLSLRLNFLHASPTEFIVVFHAPHRTAGFSGDIRLFFDLIFVSWQIQCRIFIYCSQRFQISTCWLFPQQILPYFLAFQFIFPQVQTSQKTSCPCIKGIEKQKEREGMSRDGGVYRLIFL